MRGLTEGSSVLFSRGSMITAHHFQHRKPNQDHPDQPDHQDHSYHAAEAISITPVHASLYLLSPLSIQVSPPYIYAGGGTAAQFSPCAFIEGAVSRDIAEPYSAMARLLLQLPLPGIWQLVLLSGLFYGSRCYGVVSHMATSAWIMTLDAMKQLLLCLPLPGIWLSVLWSGFYYGYRCLEYGSRCYGVTSALATAARNMALGAVERLLRSLMLPRIWPPVL